MLHGLALEGWKYLLLCTPPRLKTTRPQGIPADQYQIYDATILEKVVLTFRYHCKAVCVTKDTKIGGFQAVKNG